MPELLGVFFKEMRELFQARRNLGLAIAHFSIFFLIFGVYFPIRFDALWRSGSIWAGMIFLFLPALISSALIADSLAGERERKTLETLLTTPYPLPAILGGKALAVFAYAWSLVVLCIVMTPVSIWVASPGGTAGQIINARQLFIALAGSGAMAVLAVILGLLSSMRSQTVRESQQRMAILWMILMGGVILLMPQMSTRFPEPGWGALVAAALLLFGVEVGFFAVIVSRVGRVGLVLD